ncbi:hypothetical protein R0J90_23010, partial [Micrococcus sp. SIMBA_144]
FRIELLKFILYNDEIKVRSFHEYFFPTQSLFNFYLNNLNVLIKNIEINPYFDGYQYGFADLNENIIISCTYDDVRQFS